MKRKERKEKGKIGEDFQKKGELKFFVEVKVKPTFAFGKKKRTYVP